LRKIAFEAEAGPLATTLSFLLAFSTLKNYFLKFDQTGSKPRLGFFLLSLTLLLRYSGSPLQRSDWSLP
jgi:hypothetical protein